MDCKNCENEIMLQLADAQMELDRQNNYVRLLNKCLDVKEELLKGYRDENDNLKNRVEFLEEISKQKKRA